MRFFALEQPKPRTIIAAIYDPEGFRGAGTPLVAGQTPTADAEEQRNYFIAQYALSVPENQRMHLEVEDDGTFKGWLISISR